VTVRLSTLPLETNLTGNTLVLITDPNGPTSYSTTIASISNYITSNLSSISGVVTLGSAKFNGSTSAFGINSANIAETANIISNAINATPTAYFNTGALQLYTTPAGANWTQNLTFSSGTTLASALSVGQAATISILATQSSTPYYMNGSLTIDGSSSNITTYWQGGTAPLNGNSNGIDVYTYTVIKTAMTPSYTVLASRTQF
jgi:hypothetical protein